MNAAPLAAANMRLRKIVRSSMGATPRCSIHTKAGRSTAAAMSPPITSGSFQPSMPPREIPYTSPVSPMTKTAVPGRSRPRRTSVFASSCSTSAPHAAPARPSGTLNQKTQCQEIATSTPPSTGPSTSPTAATMVFVPIARPSSCRGNASVTSAAEFANRNAPPMPCTIRQAMSSAPLAAKPAPSEASEKTTKPPT